MRLPLTFSIIFLFIQTTFAQKIVAPIEQAEKYNISITKPGKYADATHSDPALALFTGPKEKDFYEAYQKLLVDLQYFLKQNGFRWEKKVRCFNKIYFSKNGAVDYFFFHFNPDEVDIEKQGDFQKLAGRFIQNYKINIKANKKFSQCSPVSYIDIK